MMQSHAPGPGPEIAEWPSEDLLDPNANLTAAILRVIVEANGPVGARHIGSRLATLGYEPSESTIARRLRHLDTQGYTRSAGRNGRVATALGVELIEHRQRDARPGVPTRGVLDAQSLLDLLDTRRAIEPPAVRDVTEHASDIDLRDMLAIVESHLTGEARSGPTLPGIEFHRAMGAMIRNPFLSSAHAMVFSTNLHYVDHTLDVILGIDSHDGTTHATHQVILEAMSAREPDRAAEAMRRHVEQLLTQTRAFIEANSAALVERILATSWNATATRPTAATPVQAGRPTPPR